MATEQSFFSGINSNLLAIIKQVYFSQPLILIYWTNNKHGWAYFYGIHFQITFYSAEFCCSSCTTRGHQVGLVVYDLTTRWPTYGAGSGPMIKQDKNSPHTCVSNHCIDHSTRKSVLPPSWLAGWVTEFCSLLTGLERRTDGRASAGADVMT